MSGEGPARPRTRASPLTPDPTTDRQLQKKSLNISISILVAVAVIAWSILYGIPVV